MRKRRNTPWAVEGINQNFATKFGFIVAVFFFFIIYADISIQENVKEIQDEAYSDSYIVVDESRRDSFRMIMRLNPAIWEDLNFIRILGRRTLGEENRVLAPGERATVGLYFDGGFYTYSENSDPYPTTTIHEIGHHLYDPENTNFSPEERKDWDERSNKTRREYWKENDHYAEEAYEDFAESWSFFVEIQDNGGLSIKEAQRKRFIEDWRYEWIKQYICNNYKCVLFIDSSWFKGNLTA